MPYTIKKLGNKFTVVNTDTGKVKGKHGTRAGAERQRRLLEGVHRGWEPTGKRAKR